MPVAILPAASPDALALLERRDRLRRLMAGARLFNASDAAAMPSPPTVTGSATPTAGLTVQYRMNAPAQVALFALYGGKPLAYGVYIRGQTVSVPSGGNVDTTHNGVGLRMAFVTDSPSFDILVLGQAAAVKYRLLQDGQYVDKAGYSTATTSGGNYLNVANATRKARRYDVEFEQAGGFGGVNLAPGDGLRAVAAADRYRVAVIGDSITAGTGAGAIGNGWAFHAARRLGNMDVDLVAMGLGGTGYVNPGLTWKFGDHLDDLLGYGAAGIDELWIAGGANDVDSPTLLANAQACFQGARARLPLAPIIVLGGFVANSNAATALATETTVKAAFDAWGDPNSAFVPFNLASPKLQTGTSAAPTTGNYQYYMAGGDGTHPAAAGHDFIGAFVAEARRAIPL